MFYLDPYFLLLIPPMLLALYASSKVRSTFEQYSRYRPSSGMTGAQAARGILDANGLFDVKIERINGSLTDHYDPRAGVLRLSEPVYGSSSLAAVGVAAHEAGHALQHARGYVPLRLRQGIWPAAAFGSNLGPIVAIVGIMMLALTHASFGMLIAQIGVGIFAVATVFTVLTLPVEMNASRRALAALSEAGYVSGPERGHAKKVLDAAALTYMAAAFMSIMMLLRFILLLSSFSRRN
jgi:Zn-dependent membrane protease YugP